ncbi:helix-turn-helix domain-containing protein [Nocardia sp. NPDC055321]
MADGDSSITRRQLGRYLRDAREAVGMTLEDAAKLMEWGKSSLQRLEKGQNQKIRTRDLDGLIEIYAIDPDRAAGLRGLAQQAAEKSWWHEFGDVIPANFSVYMALESAAEALTSFQPDLVPGLLQTADYARVLARSANPGDTAYDLEGRVQLKIRRQRQITRSAKPASLTVVLGEAVLRRMIGGPEVMSAQLRHLADMGTRPNVTIKVLPLSAGYPTGDQIGPFVILEFAAGIRNEPVEPTIVYAEGYTSDMYSEKPNTVERYVQAYKILQRASLDETISRSLLRDKAREYQRER